MCSTVTLKVSMYVYFVRVLINPRPRRGQRVIVVGFVCLFVCLFVCNV